LKDTGLTDTNQAASSTNAGGDYSGADIIQVNDSQGCKKKKKKNKNKNKRPFGQMAGELHAHVVVDVES